MLAAVAGLLAAGCAAPAAGRPPGAAGGTLTVGLAEVPGPLNPTTSTSIADRIVFANMCQKLYDVNAGLKLAPQLAAALPKISANGLTYTITLRPGVKFNDGTPLTAAAVQTTLNWYRTAPQSARASELAPVKAVKVTGPLTLQLRLSTPFAPLTSVLAEEAGMILSPTQLHKLGTSFASDPVCVGPFSFTGRPNVDQINLVKSKYYYGRAAVHLSRLVFRVITDPVSRAADLESGYIQVADRLAPQNVAAVERNPRTTVIGENGLGYTGLDINVGNVTGVGHAPGTASNPFATYPQLRQAFELSISRIGISRAVFAGQYTPACSPIPPSSPWAVPITCPRHNVALAGQQITAIGLTTPIPVSLMVPDSPPYLQAAAVIRNMAKPAGFNVKIQPVAPAAAQARAAAGKYEMYLASWPGGIDPDQNIYPAWYRGSALDYTGAHYFTLDHLLTQARATTSTAARKTLYDRIVPLLQQDQNVIYLWYDKLELGLRRNITGVSFSPDGAIRLAGAQTSRG